MDRSKKLKAEILPYDECDVEELLNKLQTKGFIRRYTASDNGTYIQIEKFTKHQNPHVKEPGSEIPAPEGHPDNIRQEQFGYGTSTGQAPEFPEPSGPSTLNLKPSTLNLKPESGTSKYAIQLPVDFKPNANNEKLARELGLDLAVELEAFSDYHQSKGNRYTKWHLALNTWLRNSIKFSPKKVDRHAKRASEINDVREQTRNILRRKEQATNQK
jgi:hypothetical protein